MLTSSKKAKLVSALKSYRKNYLDKNLAELDESGTRIMINAFLSEVLGFLPLEEIKTEYMIKGTYADYMVQIGGNRHFLVEVKALSLDLSEKHLRQTINYGANEGVEYALLTNGRSFDFYRIIFSQPIAARKLFSIDLGDPEQFKHAIDYLEYLHKESVIKNGFDMLWNKCEAIDPLNIAGMLISEPLIAHIKGMIRKKYGEKCNEDDILKSVNYIITQQIDPTEVRPFKAARIKRKQQKKEKSYGGDSTDMVMVPAVVAGVRVDA